VLLFEPAELQTTQCILEGAPSKSRPRGAQLLGSPIDLFDEIIVKGHLYRSHGREPIAMSIAIQLHSSERGKATSLSTSWCSPSEPWHVLLAWFAVPVEPPASHPPDHLLDRLRERKNEFVARQRDRESVDAFSSSA